MYLVLFRYLKLNENYKVEFFNESSKTIKYEVMRVYEIYLEDTDCKVYNKKFTETFLFWTKHSVSRTIKHEQNLLLGNKINASTEYIQPTLIINYSTQPQLSV